MTARSRARAEVPHSDHFDGRRFHNLGGVRPPAVREVARMLREKRAPWPGSVPVVQVVPPQRANDDETIITFIGHSTFLVQSAHGNLITDPIFADRAGPFGIAGPRRARRPAVAIDKLPEISVVLLSHSHYDHCDIGSLRALQKKFAPLFVTPLGNARHLRKAGAGRIEELDWWETAGSAPMPVAATPAQHFSARTPFDRNVCLWGGFHFVLGGKKYFFAGDTGYGQHFRQIRERLGEMDVCILPIGAYEPRWFMKPLHMNPEEAVQAHLDLGSRTSVASHFGTFQLTLEAIDAPIHALSRALAERGMDKERFRVLEFGGSLHVGSTA